MTYNVFGGTLSLTQSINPLIFPSAGRQPSIPLGSLGEGCKFAPLQQINFWCIMAVRTRVMAANVVLFPMKKMQIGIGRDNLKKIYFGVFKRPKHAALERDLANITRQQLRPEHRSFQCSLKGESRY